MTWTLITSNTTEDTLIVPTQGLPLFSTTNLSNSSLFTVDPQAHYYEDTPADFEFLDETNLILPTPTSLELYVLNHLVTSNTLAEVSNIHRLYTNTFYRDLNDNKTYVLCDSSLASVIQVVDTEYTDWVVSENVFEYTSEDYDFTNLVKISVNGLVYLPGDGFNHTFSIVSSSEVVINSEVYCGPQPGDLLTFIFEIPLDTLVKSFSVFSFDFSSQDVDMIDSLPYNNQVFQISSQIQSNTLLYNRIKKLALCII